MNYFMYLIFMLVRTQMTGTKSKIATIMKYEIAGQ